MNNLPHFQRRSRTRVQAYIEQVLVNHTSDGHHLVKLIEFPDGHYRAIFKKTYFAVPEVTKSQWNTFKKKMKRLDKRVFIFKQHGEMGPEHFYIDFGFFAQ